MAEAFKVAGTENPNSMADANEVLTNAMADAEGTDAGAAAGAATVLAKASSAADLTFASAMIGEQVTYVSSVVNAAVAWTASTASAIFGATPTFGIFTTGTQATATTSEATAWQGYMNAAATAAAAAANARMNAWSVYANATAGAAKIAADAEADASEAFTLSAIDDFLQAVADQAAAEKTATKDIAADQAASQFRWTSWRIFVLKRRLPPWTMNPTVAAHSFRPTCAEAMWRRLWPTHKEQSRKM